MEITIQYIISQVFTVISYIFLALTYQVKNRRNVITFNLLAQIAFIVAYILLGAWSGLAMVFVAIARNIIFIIDENKNGKRNTMGKIDIVVLIVVYIISTMSGIFTYQGLLSLIPVLATMLYTYAVCQKNIKTYKLLGIPTEILWTFYNFYIKSILGIILQAVMLVSCFIGYFREAKKNKEEKSENCK